MLCCVVLALTGQPDAGRLRTVDGAVCCVVLCCVVLALSPVSRTPGGCGQWTVLYVVLCCVV